MGFPRFVVAGLGAALALAAQGASTANAALPSEPCGPSGFQCATLDVPVDRSGRTPGTIRLSVTTAPASGAGPVAVVALAGGPGQAAQPIAASFKRELAPLLAGSDLLVPDQRGTGNSNPLQCAALQTSSPSLATVTRRCAEQLGPARAFFTTRQSVEDLESLRIAGGYAKLFIYGVSYGTKVALAYAAAHPATTQGLILDSVVTPEGPDALRRSTLGAVPRVIGTDLCGDGECRGISPDAVADVRELAAKLATKRLSGPVFDGRGKRYTARLSADGLVSILVAGDLDPTLRAELPGSLRAVLNGDVRPILRLSARSAGLENRADPDGPSPVRYQQVSADSDALFFTTVCEESASMPWTRGAPQAQREKEAESFLKTAPAETFGIFPKDVGLAGLPSLCLGWPVASPPPDAPGPLPDVPVLILNGLSDLRTPVEDAQVVAKRFARVALVAVPHAGHSVLGSDPGTCAAKAIEAFAGGAVPSVCPAIDNPFSPTQRPPASLSKVTAARGFSPKVGRTLNAVSATFTDARRQVIGAAIGTGRLPGAVGGLRNGSVKVTSLTRLTLRAYEYIPGVRVSGSFNSSGTSKVTISGRSAAAGTLTVRGNRVTGRLGGKRVNASSGRAALRAFGPGAGGDGLPSPADALERGRLVAASR